MSPRNTYSGKKRRVRPSGYQPSSADVVRGRSPKRSKRLEGRAAQSRPETRDKIQGHDAVKTKSPKAREAEGDRAQRAEVRNEDSSRPERREADELTQEDIRKQYAHLRQNGEDEVLRSPVTEPSTVTTNRIVGGSVRGAHEATTEEITINHPSKEPADDDRPEGAADEDDPVLQEGAGAMEPGDYNPRAPPNRHDDEEGRRIEAIQSMMDDTSDRDGVMGRREDGKTTSSSTGKDTDNLSDCENSPPYKRKVAFKPVPPRPDPSLHLEAKFALLEKELKTMVGALDAKLDRVLKRLGHAKDEVEGDMVNVVHSLCYHLENNISSPSYIENKVLPLRTILNEGIHRKCVTKYIVDRLVKALETTPTLTPKCIEKVAEVIRIVLYSKPSGGKKDTSAEDEPELEDSLIDMKKKVTFIIVNTIQNRPRLGSQILTIDGTSKAFEKPSWMQPGFTTAKHIVQFFSRTTRRKKTPEKPGDRDVMCAAIIRTINEHNGKAFAKIRDRTRADTFKEVFFIHENSGIDLEKTRDVMEGPVNINKIPLVNISKVPAAKVKKVLKKIWDETVEIVGEKVTYHFTYDVDVTMKSGIVERKTLVRKMNFLYCAALVLMRITGNGSFFDLLTYHEKIIHVIVCIAELLVTITEADFNGKDGFETEREECDVGDDGYHTLNVLSSIRPTQIETRQELVREHILKITEDEYEKLHYHREEDEGRDDGSERPKDDDDGGQEVVPSDDEDDTLFAEELGGAMQFMSKA